MKIRNTIIIIAGFLSISILAHTQDLRLLETKIADLLTQFPANSTQYTEKLMNDMLALGDAGIRQICSMIVPAGTGDDTKPRFAIESLSRYLSKGDKDAEKELWEKICLDYSSAMKDPMVRDFFMKQLQLVGSEASIGTLSAFLNDKEICNSALGAIVSIKSPGAETALAEALKNRELPCAAAVMNELASMKSQLAVDEYIAWLASENINIRASALNALAFSGSPVAFSPLSKAAGDVLYKWEPTGATSALLNYAAEAGVKGDKKTADRICKLLLAKCDDKSTIQYKTGALEIYTRFNGPEAIGLLKKAAGHPDRTYRNAALRLSLDIPGNEIVRTWTGLFPKAIPEAKPEILTWFGLRGDKSAIPLITESLSHADQDVRMAAAASLAKLSGQEAVPSLVGYLLRSTGEADQEAVKSALKSVAGNEQMDLIYPVLNEGSVSSKKSAIELFAWNGDHKYFNDVFALTSSPEDQVKDAAIKSLAALAGAGDQEKLIDLLNSTNDKAQISDIQTALASAAAKTTDPDLRSATILKSLKNSSVKERIIPVLARTGGAEALDLVLKEFENGTPEMRDICFSTLTSWNDYTASSALYTICASGNKTFEERAFNGYLRQIRSAPVPDEQKLLLLRKILPYALSADRKNSILTQAGRLKTYQALFLAGNFLDDPSTSAAAARAAMNIALPAEGSTGLYGKMVADILSRAAPKLSGPEIEYEKERISKYIAGMPTNEGFKPMFNGRDLTGWQGLVENPVARARMSRTELARKQAEANVMVPANWSVKDGYIWFNGKGSNLCTVEEYGDFEMLVDWRITRDGDSGIYLRGTPQVQIWDTSRTDVGAQVGSGGLYNNQVNPSKPLKVADNPVGDWNTFRIVMTGDKVSVWLNGILVTDNVVMENYWDRKSPIFPTGPIELQAHGTDLAFRDLYIREIDEKDFNLTPEELTEGYVSLFNGRNLDNWLGNKESYVVEEGLIVIKPENGSGGNLYTEKEYADFIFRFEFQLTPGANNGLGIRAPLEGDAAYVGMELQILDDTAPVYAGLQPYQYHGSVYGVIPAKRGFLKPVGEWNFEEVYVSGTKIRITLNGTVIVDGDIAEARDTGTMDHNEHPGLKNTTGHIGFLGHGSVVKFRNLRIKDLTN